MSELSDFMRSVVEASGSEIETLTRRLDAAEARVKVLEEALAAIHLRLAPGNRTFDEIIREAMYADDIARAALGSKEEGGR